MKKFIRVLTIVLMVTLVVGCSCSKKETKNTEVNDNKQTVIKDQKLEGLEFVNVSVNNNSIKTIVMNNTGYLYEGSKFKIKIMDENGNALLEVEDEVKEKMETGTTAEIETKINADLSRAASIEYSIIK